ncbi:MAG: PhnE/PtxC family ABC transporter permease, partial [Rhodospirillales bacterium]
MTLTAERAIEATIRQEAAIRWRRFVKGLGWAVVAAVVLWFTASQIGINPVALLRGTKHMWDFLTRMLPPDLSYFALLGGATRETIQIAVWGTLLAVVFSIPLSLLAARNTTPHIPLPRFGRE